MNLGLFLLLPIFARAADYSELKAGVAFTLKKAAVAYDLDSANHWFRPKHLPRWTERDESSPISIFGIGLNRAKLPAGTEGVMVKDAYLRTLTRGRTHADAIAVFRVGSRHFVLINSTSEMTDDLNLLIHRVRAWPEFALRPPPGAVAALPEQN